jgi:hypothetical protein
MTSWIVGCFILGVGFYNIYLVFLQTKNLKSSQMWVFQLLVHFFINLLFSISKTSFIFHCLFLLFCFSAKKDNWKTETNKTLIELHVSSYKICQILLKCGKNLWVKPGLNFQNQIKFNQSSIKFRKIGRFGHFWIFEWRQIFEASHVLLLSKLQFNWSLYFFFFYTTLYILLVQLCLPPNPD